MGVGAWGGSDAAKSRVRRLKGHKDLVTFHPANCFMMSCQMNKYSLFVSQSEEARKEGRQQGSGSHLGGQESCQVDLRDHLAAAVALLLVAVLVVLDQVPDLDPTLQVGGDHGGARTQAVGASRVLDHVLCEQPQTRRDR